MKTKLFQMLGLCLSMLLLGISNSGAQAAKKPVVGDQAPLVSGLNQDGKEWKLADSVGKKAVPLYFYPKDETPGCTKEACGLRDSMGDLQKADVEVVGVSFDSAESHKSFIAKHNLNFALIADTDGKVVDAFLAAHQTYVAGLGYRAIWLVGPTGEMSREVG